MGYAIKPTRPILYEDKGIAVLHADPCYMVVSGFKTLKVGYTFKIFEYNAHSFTEALEMVNSLLAKKGK